MCIPMPCRELGAAEVAEGVVRGVAAAAMAEERAGLGQHRDVDEEITT